MRYVHDHTLFCPGLNKYREDGELCHDPMGRACLEHYWLVVRSVDEDTVLVVALAPEGNVGKARFLMRRYVPALQAEL